jgi:hypothetical protein
MVLSLVAMKAEKIVGHIAFSRMRAPFELWASVPLLSCQNTKTGALARN